MWMNEHIDRVDKPHQLHTYIFYFLYYLITTRRSVFLSMIFCYLCPVSIMNQKSFCLARCVVSAARWLVVACAVLDADATFALCWLTRTDKSLTLIGQKWWIGPVVQLATTRRTPLGRELGQCCDDNLCSNIIWNITFVRSNAYWLGLDHFWRRFSHQSLIVSLASGVTVAVLWNGNKNTDTRIGWLCDFVWSRKTK